MQPETIKNMTDEELHQQQLEYGTNSPLSSKFNAEMEWRRDKATAEQFKELEARKKELENKLLAVKKDSREIPTEEQINREAEALREKLKR